MFDLIRSPLRLQKTNLPAEKIAETLKDLLREANVTTKNAGVSIPFSRSLLTLVELPRRANAEEQKTVISLEARKYIPVPVQEVQLDWFVLPEGLTEGAELSQKVKVLIVAVHNDELALLQKVVEGAALLASFYEIEIFSTIRSVVDEPIKPVLILDIGASEQKSMSWSAGLLPCPTTFVREDRTLRALLRAHTTLKCQKQKALRKSTALETRRLPTTARPLN